MTTFLLKQEIDTGDLILQEKEPIHFEDNVGTLYERMMNKGSKLVLKTVELIQEGNYTPIPQIMSAELKKAPKIFKETCEINFQKTSLEVYNFIRGLSPYPSAWTLLQGKMCKMYAVSPMTNYAWKSPENYETDGKSYLYFKTLDGAVSILELQLEGKKKMNIEEFLRGFRF
jgi:methionyl-tRNA formyltransferase